MQTSSIRHGWHRTLCLRFAQHATYSVERVRERHDGSVGGGRGGVSKARRLRKTARTQAQERANEKADINEIAQCGRGTVRRGERNANVCVCICVRVCVCARAPACG